MSHPRVTVLASTSTPEPDNVAILDDPLTPLGKYKLVPIGYSLADDPAAVERANRAIEAMPPWWTDDDVRQVLRAAEGDDSG